MLHRFRVRKPDANIADAYMFASTVSSKILASMAKKEGFKFEVNIFRTLKKMNCTSKLDHVLLLICWSGNFDGL